LCCGEEGLGECGLLSTGVNALWTAILRQCVETRASVRDVISIAV